MSKDDVKKTAEQYQTVIAVTEIADAISECARIRELTVLLMKYLIESEHPSEAFKNAQQVFKHADKSMRLASAALNRLADVAGIKETGGDIFFVGEGGKA